MALRPPPRRLPIALLLLVVLFTLLPARLEAQTEDASTELAEDAEQVTPTPATDEPTAESPASSDATSTAATPVESPIAPTQPATATSTPPVSPDADTPETAAGDATPTPTATPDPSAGTARPSPVPTRTPTGATVRVDAESITSQAVMRGTKRYVPSADARVEQHRPTSRLGHSTSIRAAERTRSSSAVYLRFDVSGLRGTVVDARLRLYVIDGTDDAPTVSGADNRWAEGTITWRSQPVRTTGAVDNRGRVSTGRWLSYDVTALVDRNGQVSFLLTGGSSDAVTFSARESSRNRPELVVTLGPANERPPRKAPPPPASPTATPRPAATATPRPISPTATPRPASPTATPVDTGDEAASLRWGVIGGDHSRAKEIRAAGVGVVVMKVSWRALQPGPETVDAAVVERKRAEITRLREAGFAIIVDIGLQDTPAWVHTAYPNARYVNQYGQPYTGDGNIDAGDANLIFNSDLRAAAGRYVDVVFASFGTDFYGVRFGGGRYGELTYPPHNFAGSSNSYWAFDGAALATNPVPGWRPGDPSPNGEAGRFLDWYLDAMVEFQNWQIASIRRSYDGLLMALYPSWGLRPGQVEQAVATNLIGDTSAERNGEVQRGYDFARQVAAITDPGVVLTTTWLDAPERFAGPGNPTPVAYLAELAAAHPLRLRLYGENTGSGGPAEMAFSAAQAHRYGLLGMTWYREEQLFLVGYASLDDYRRVMASYAD